MVADGQIQSLTPDRGQIGIQSVISGTGLLGGGTTVTVTLAGIVATVLSASDTAIEVEADIHQTLVELTGLVLIVAETGAIVQRADAWTYNGRGRIQQVSPNSGQYGTLVTLQGVNLIDFSGVAEVTLAGVVSTVV